MDTCRIRNPKSVALVAGLGLLAGAIYYTFSLRRRQNCWGATKEEVAMPLPGDGIVRHANFNSTRAITIWAKPEDIWPWIVQMGKGRGGLYSYDWLDMAFQILDKPSSEEILSDFQHLQAGDVIPIGDDEDSDDDFYVHEVIPNEALVIGANAANYRDRVSWAIALKPVGSDVTRLIMRVRGDIPMDAKGIATYALLEPAAFIMVRKQMMNLKRLGEKLRAQREGA